MSRTSAGNSGPKATPSLGIGSDRADDLDALDDIRCFLADVATSVTHFLVTTDKVASSEFAVL